MLGIDSDEEDEVLEIPPECFGAARQLSLDISLETGQPLYTPQKMAELPS